MESVELHTTCTMLLVMDIMKPDSPSAVMFRTMENCRRMEDRRRCRIVVFPVRNRKVQSADTN